MLQVSRKTFNLQGLKCLRNVQRAACFDRFSEILSWDTLQNASNDESPKGGYGTKTFFLLGPRDIRTPLPGETGIAPFLCNDKISQLPESAGDKCEIITSQLPEERYQNLLTQVACVICENILSSYPVECVGYDCPQLLKKDFSELFPSRDLNNGPLSVITMCQKTENNMSEWSEDAEIERSVLESNFKIAAVAICAQLKCNNYWADFIHPNSGKPNFESLTNATMFETDLRYRHFGFTIEDLGCCRIMMYKEWGSHVFIGTIFTNAPLNSKELQNLLNHHKFIHEEW